MTYIVMLIITIPLAYLWKIQMENPSLYPCVTLRSKYKISYNKNLGAAITFAPLYFIYAFQYSLHTDYDNYEKTFYQIKSGTGKIRELGVDYINRFVANMNLDFQFVYIIIYLIAFIILAKCLMEYSADFSISIILFITVFFILGFMQLRQLVAVIISFYSYRFIGKKKLVAFMITIALASLFHVSALIMIPAYWFLKHTFRLSYYMIAIGIFSVLNLMKTRVLTWIVKNIFPSYLGRHEMFRNMTINKWDAIFLIVLLFLSAIYYKRIQEKGAPNVCYMNGLFIYAILFFLGRWIFEFDRFGYYFYFPIICLVPNMIACEKNLYFRWVLKISIFMTAIVIWFIKYHTFELFSYVNIFM